MIETQTFSKYTLQHLAIRIIGRNLAEFKLVRNLIFGHGAARSQNKMKEYLLKYFEQLIDVVSFEQRTVYFFQLQIL